MDYSDDLTSTRTVMPYFWEHWFFSPHNINYHIEHHLYASVPYYRLPELSRILMANPGICREGACDAWVRHRAVERDRRVNEQEGRKVRFRRGIGAAGRMRSAVSAQDAATENRRR